MKNYISFVLIFFYTTSFAKQRSCAKEVYLVFLVKSQKVLKEKSTSLIDHKYDILNKDLDYYSRQESDKNKLKEIVKNKKSLSLNMCQIDEIKRLIFDGYRDLFLGIKDKCDFLDKDILTNKDLLSTIKPIENVKSVEQLCLEVIAQINELKVST